jgi:hypothetical protein
MRIRGPAREDRGGGTGGPVASGARTGLQRLADASPAVQRLEALQAQEAGSAASGPDGGLPAGLRAGVESLSGLSLSDVRVHYDSARPAAVAAHAFAQGSDIHVAPGQERHLAHEAWHVVQQRQGRVRPTTSVGGVAVNDDPGLEAEADRMGGRALSAEPPGAAERD